MRSSLHVRAQRSHCCMHSGRHHLTQFFFSLPPTSYTLTFHLPTTTTTTTIMTVQLLVLCLMVGLSAVSGQRIYRPLPSGQESLRHGPRALEIAVKTGEHVIIPISMASQVAFMQEAVQASIDCLPWLMNFPGGTIQWYRELYNEQGMPRKLI